MNTYLQNSITLHIRELSNNHYIVLDLLLWLSYYYRLQHSIESRLSVLLSVLNLGQLIPHFLVTLVCIWRAFASVH